MDLPFSLFPGDPPHPDARSAIEVCPACDAPYGRAHKQQATCKACGVRVKRSRLDSVFRTAEQEREAYKVWVRRRHLEELSSFAEHLPDGRAEILSVGGDECVVCAASSGKVYPVLVALRTMPLPHVDCTCKGADGIPIWCRCVWLLSG